MHADSLVTLDLKICHTVLWCLMCGGMYYLYFRGVDTRGAKRHVACARWCVIWLGRVAILTSFTEVIRVWRIE
jgi:hypothetical protein